MKTELLIAGIPAGEWVNRRVRFWGNDVGNGNSRKRHPTPCLIKGIDNRKVIILPVGHKQTELVDPADIAPTWKNNDDLRQKYASQLNGSMVEDPPDDESEDSTVVEDTTAPEPEVTPEPPKVQPLPLPRHPKMVIHRHDSEWQPTYQRYIDSLRAEASDLHLLDEIHASIEAGRRKQGELIDELKELGVEIIAEEPAVEPAAKSPDDTKPTYVQPFKFNKGRFERLVGQRMTNELVRWGHTLRKRLEAGEEIEGTVNSLAAEIGTSWETLRSRFDIIEKRCHIKFSDENGNQGRKVSGNLRITAV